MDYVDVDLEDLEVMLYSQVFHANTSEEKDDTMITNLNKPEDGHKGRNSANAADTRKDSPHIRRYYNADNKNKHIQTCHVDRTLPNVYQTQRRNMDMATSSNFDKNLEHSNAVTLQPVYMQPPVNNIVLIPPPPTQIITTNLGSKKEYKKILKMQERLQRRLKARRERKRLKRQKKKKDSAVIRDKTYTNFVRAIRSYNGDDDVEILNMSEEVICISDDDTKANIAAEIKPNEKEITQTHLDEDDDDDVIYIPPDPKANAVINLDPDEDVEIQKKADVNNKDIASKSQSSKNVITPSERKEMLSTPESTTSNDFLDNSTIDTRQTNFNFSLHGSDFVPASTEFLRPKTPADQNDIYETESSCSASDIIQTKTSVFHEIEFDSPKDLFKDNLENFGNYIVPKRSETTNISSILTPTFTSEKSDDKGESQPSRIENDSDSSSESEYAVETAASKRKLKVDNAFSKKNLANNEAEEQDVDKTKNNEEEIRTITKIDSDKPKRKSKELTEVALSKKKLKPEQSGGNLKSSNAIMIDENSNSSTSSIFMLSDLTDFNTDLSLANCSGVDNQDSPTSKVYKPRSFKEHWTTDMRKFYSQDWDLANFTMEKVLATMSDDPKKWRISFEDNDIINLTTFRGRKCYICRERGHSAVKCPKKFKPIKCSLCGGENHMEPRCPNKLCTQCGRKSNFHSVYCNFCMHERKSKCTLCLLTGHIRERCPDIWRRYYNTTTEARPEPLKVFQLIPQNKRWCSGCAQSGHFEHTCKNYSRTHPPVTPSIISNKDVYHFETKPSGNGNNQSSNNNSEAQQKRNFKTPETKAFESQQIGEMDNIHNKNQSSFMPNDLVNDPSLTASNIFIKVDAMGASQGKQQFSVNREFYMEPTMSQLPQTITIANQSAMYNSNPLMYQLPQLSSYIPLFNTNVLPTNSMVQFSSVQPNASNNPTIKRNFDINANNQQKTKIMKIKAEHACFLLEEMPGIDLIHNFENEFNVSIKIWLDHQRNGMIKVLGDKQFVGPVKTALNRYLQEEIRSLIVPNDSQDFVDFIKTYWKPGIQKLAARRFTAYKYFKKMVRRTENTCKKLDFMAKMRSDIILINQYVAANTSGFSDIKHHMTILRNVWNSNQYRCVKFQRSQYEQIKESFYYVFYKTKPDQFYNSVFITNN